MAIGSKDLEAVLRFFSEAEEEFARAHDEQELCEDRQQDILHDLELVDHTHNERGHMGKELTAIRRQRRAAKNAYELLTPLRQWLTENAHAMNILKRVLGEMRKIEDRQKNRIYRRRADGKGEIIEATKKD